MKTPLPPLPDIEPRPGKPALIVDAAGRASIADTAEYFDLDVKRLNGWIYSNQLTHPLGNVAEGWVYAWSVERYLKRFAHRERRKGGFMRGQ